MDEFAAAAGVAVRTLYRLFGSRQALPPSEVVEQIVQVWLRAMAPDGEPEAGPA